MKPVLSNDTQPHAVSLESSTTPLRHCDLTSHFVWKLLQLVSNLLHQNRHDVQDKARFSASRSCLSFNRRWSRADHTTNTDSYVPSTTRMLKNSSQYFITAFPYVYGICYHVKKRLVWRPRLSVCLSVCDPQSSVHIHEMLCGVYVLQMSRMCGFGANQLSETYFS